MRIRIAPLLLGLLAAIVVANAAATAYAWVSLRGQVATMQALRNDTIMPVQRLKALSEKARADRETTRRTIAQAVRSAYFGVVSGTGQVKALEAAQASSQSALDANKLGYQVGVRINIDVLNAQSQLFQTQRDLAVARYNVLVGQLRLKQAGGVLKAEDLQPVNALLTR